MFLQGESDLDSFEDWFVRNTWNIHLGGSIAAENLTFAVEESLSEFSSRHINESELRHEFGNLIQRDNTFILVYAAAPQPIPIVSSDSAILIPVRL